MKRPESVDILTEGIRMYKHPDMTKPWQERIRTLFEEHRQEATEGMREAKIETKHFCSEKDCFVTDWLNDMLAKGVKLDDMLCIVSFIYTMEVLQNPDRNLMTFEDELFSHLIDAKDRSEFADDVIEVPEDRLSDLTMNRYNPGSEDMGGQRLLMDVMKSFHEVANLLLADKSWNEFYRDPIFANTEKEYRQVITLATNEAGSPLLAVNSIVPRADILNLSQQIFDQVGKHVCLYHTGGNKIWLLAKDSEGAFYDFFIFYPGLVDIVQQVC